MIQNLSIHNFKSIKSLDIDCKRVNILIGEPNTGKSNILEALSFFSPNMLSSSNLFKEVFRFRTMGDFFYDNNYSSPVKVNTGDLSFELSFARNESGAILNEFNCSFFISPPSRETQIAPQQHNGTIFNHKGEITRFDTMLFNTAFRTYIFKRLKSFTQSFRSFLDTPFGENLPNLLLSNNELKKMVSNFFRERGFRVSLNPVENDINIVKEVEEEIYSYPYSAISETLQRIIFLMLAIESNKNATLILDEPEANTFPFYTKYIAERIARDETNQFFITTHNPYLLMNIIENTKLDDLAIFVCTLEDYQTKLFPLNKKQIEEAFDLGPDVFFNLKRIIE